MRRESHVNARRHVFVRDILGRITQSTIPVVIVAALVGCQCALKDAGLLIEFYSGSMVVGTTIHTARLKV